MHKIQVGLDSKLLKAADRAAKREHINRSALIRQALERHLQHLHTLELDERERRGYLAQPQKEEEYLPWQEAASWPPL